jgi:putative cell wall-binding protein
MDLREEIKKQSGIIPVSVQNGSIQNVIRWKDRAVKSLNVANNPKSTEYELRQALSQLMRNQ